MMPYATTIIVKAAKIANSVTTRSQCEMAEQYCRNAIRYISATRPEDMNAQYTIHLLQEQLNKLFIRWYTCLV